MRGGADVEMVVKNGDTPLHRACVCGHKEIVEYLIEKRNCKTG